MGGKWKCFTGTFGPLQLQGLTQKCGRITSATFLHLLKAGDLCGWFHLSQCCDLYTILFHSKQACIYTTEDTIVCDEIYIYTIFHTTAWIFFWASSSLIEVPSADLVPPVPRFKPRTSGFQSKVNTTTQKGLTQKCGRITSTTTA